MAQDRKQKELLSSTKPGKCKARYTFVAEQEYLGQSTLVDRPPPVFDRRTTRSGKEFHVDEDGIAHGSESDGKEENDPTFTGNGSGAKNSKVCTFFER